MSRPTFALLSAISFLVTSPALAQDDRAAGLFAEAKQLPLVEQSARVDVVGAEARVTLVQVFANAGAAVAQADYRLDLPKDATVTSFAFWLGDRRLEATLKEKGAAARDHARAASAGRATGLLSGDRSLTTFSVYPVTAGERKRVEVQMSLPVQVEAGQSRVRLPLDRFLGQAPLTAPVVVRVRTADRLVALGADGASARVLERAERRGTLVLSANRAVEVWWREEAPPLLVRAQRVALEEDEQGLAVTVALNDALVDERAPPQVHLVIDGSFSMRRHRTAVADLVRRVRAQTGDRLHVHAVAAERRELHGPVADLVDVALSGAVGHATDWARLTETTRELGCGGVAVRCAVVTDTQLSGAARAAKAEVPVLFLATSDELAYAGDAIGDAARVYRPGADAASKLYRLADELVLPTLHVLGVEMDGAPVSFLAESRPLVPEGSALRLHGAGRFASELDVVMTLHGRDVVRTVTVADLPPASPEGAALRREVYRQRLASWMKDFRRFRDPALKERIVATSLREEIPTALTSLHVEDPALSLYAIKPGDPLLSVPAEPGLEQVIAFYPFGESRRLLRDEGRDRFVDRFLVPRRWAERGYRVDVFKVFASGRVQKADVWYKLDETGPVARLSYDEGRDQLVVGTPGSTHDVGSVVVHSADGRTLRLSPFGDEWRTEAARLGAHFTVHVRDRAGNRTSLRCLLEDGRLHLLEDDDDSAAEPERPRRRARPLTVLAHGDGARVTGRTVVVNAGGAELRFARDDVDVRSLDVTATTSLGRGRWLVGTRAGDLVRLDCAGGAACRARAVTRGFSDHPITGLVHLGGERALVGVLGRGLFEVRGTRASRARWRVGSRFITGLAVAGRDVLVGTAYNGLWRLAGGRAAKTAFPHDHVAKLRSADEGVWIASGHGRWRRVARDRFVAAGGPVPGRDGTARFVAGVQFEDRVILASFDDGLFEWRNGGLTALPFGLGGGTGRHINALLPVGDRLFVATERGLYRADETLTRVERVLDAPTYGLANKGGTVAAATQRGVFVGAARGVLRRVDPQSGAARASFSTVSFHRGALFAGGLDGLFRIDGWRWALAEEGSARLTEVGAGAGTSAGWVTALLSDGDRLWVGTYDEGVLASDGATLAGVPGLGDVWVPFHGLTRAAGALWVGGLGMGPSRVSEGGVEALTVPAGDVFGVVEVKGGVLLLTDEGPLLAPDAGPVARR